MQNCIEEGWGEDVDLIHLHKERWKNEINQERKIYWVSTHLLMSSKELVRKIKRTVRSPANPNKASKSVINVCSTFICRISGKWILSSWEQEGKRRKNPFILPQNFLRFSVVPYNLDPFCDMPNSLPWNMLWQGVWRRMKWWCNFKLEQKNCKNVPTYQLHGHLSQSFLTSVFMSLFIVQIVPAVELIELTSNEQQ